MYTPGDTENVISMERFSGMLKSVACTNTSMTLAFHDRSNLHTAESSWNWVNKADSHAFIMVAGPSDCHWNTDRQPFNVTDVTYDNDTATASLAAVPFDWKTVAHSYDLSVGHVLTSESQLRTRDHSYDKDGSINLAYSIPSPPKSVTMNGLTTTIECTNCSSTGNIDWDLKLSVHSLIHLKEASLRMTPTGVSATAALKLKESGELTKPLATSVPVVNVPIDGIEIPKLLNIGSSLEIDVGIGIDAIKGSGSITGGASLTIPDSSVAEVDLVNHSNSVFNGWLPNVEPIPVSLDAHVEATLGVYVQSALKVEFEVFGRLIYLVCSDRPTNGLARHWLRRRTGSQDA